MQISSRSIMRLRREPIGLMMPKRSSPLALSPTSGRRHPAFVRVSGGGKRVAHAGMRGAPSPAWQLPERTRWFGVIAALRWLSS